MFVRHFASFASAVVASAADSTRQDGTIPRCSHQYLEAVTKKNSPPPSIAVVVVAAAGSAAVAAGNTAAAVAAGRVVAPFADDIVVAGDTEPAAARGVDES